jgi:hemoglobin
LPHRRWPDARIPARRARCDRDHMNIYEQIGGRAAVGAAVDIFYARVIGDPVLAPYFAGTDMRRQKAHMRAFLAVALGGPEIYGGRDMGAAHAGLGVTDEAFNRVVGHLVATLVELSVPAELIAAIGAKLEPLRAVVVEAPAEAAA